MNADTSKPKAGPEQGRRWIGAALAISVVVNLLLGGYLVGRALQQDTGPGRPGLTLYHAAADLPPEARETIRSVLREHRHTFRTDMRALRAEKHALRDLMTAEEFDEEAVRAALARIRELNVRLQEGTHEATIEIGRQLSPEDRRQLNLELRRSHRDGKRHHDHRRPRGDERGDAPGEATDRP